MKENEIIDIDKFLKERAYIKYYLLNTNFKEITFCIYLKKKKKNKQNRNKINLLKAEIKVGNNISIICL